MIGLTFNMSFFPDGVLTNTDPNPIAIKVVDEIKNKFPKGDCITYDTSIKNVQGFIPTILLEKASGNYNVGLRQMKSGDSMAYITNYQQAYKDREFYINKMAEILPKYLQELEGEFNNKKCRDEFEKIRIQDMASTLTKGASKQEVSILNPNFKEQYIYIGIGAVVLLLGLYVVTKK
jgi:hypothetical protein